MTVSIAGNGKLSRSLTEGLSGRYSILPWDAYDKDGHEMIVIVHAGSGRQLEECADYCRRTGSVLVELSTGADLTQLAGEFPAIICPNTAIPVLKMMRLLKKTGPEFSEYSIEITESHQHTKTTVPGTAVELADSFGLPASKISSVRDRTIQRKNIGIPEMHLDLHAFHRISIRDRGCELKIELKVLGHESYVEGTKVILGLIQEKPLENRIYQIMELV